MSLTNIDCAIGMAGLPDGSIDVIFTDPPYVGDQYEAAYQVLADHAARLLKPSGFLVTYAGQYHLDRVMQMLGGGGLCWYWMIAQLHTGSASIIHPRKIACSWKPILIYQKPPMARPPKQIYDVSGGKWRFKRHPWEQGLETTIRVLSKLAGPGAVILDPFMGTGTNLLAAKLLGEERRYIGFEIDPATFVMAVSRLEQEPLAGRAIMGVCE